MQNVQNDLTEIILHIFKSLEMCYELYSNP